MAWAPGRPLDVCDIVVAAPKAGEVRIKILANALCHTDLHTWHGENPSIQWPQVLGHEACGVVESVGDGVEGLAPGDQVLPLYIPECGECDFCKRDDTNHCSALKATQGDGVLPDGKVRMATPDGQPLYQFMGVSSMSQYIVVPQVAAAKIKTGMPAQQCCMIGCGVSTGWGGAVKSARVAKHSTAAIWGCGAVGLSTIAGCAYAGASTIIAIDNDASKEPAARKSGATHFLNPDKLDKPLSEALEEVVEGGADFTFECVGDVDLVEQALAGTHSGWGKCCLVGLCGRNKHARFDPGTCIGGVTILGTAFGGFKGRSQMQGFVDQCESGEARVPLPDYVTSCVPLDNDKLATAMEDLDTGSAIRPVMVLDDELASQLC